MSWNQSTADKLSKVTGRTVRAYLELWHGWLVWYAGDDNSTIGHEVSISEVEDA